MNERIAEVHQHGEWIEKPFEELQKGERFRLFEKSGERVYSEKGSKQWIVTGEPHRNPSGIWQIEADVDTEIPESNYD